MELHTVGSVGRWDTACHDGQKGRCAERPQMGQKRVSPVRCLFVFGTPRVLASLLILLPPQRWQALGVYLVSGSLILALTTPAHGK